MIPVALATETSSRSASFDIGCGPSASIADRTWRWIRLRDPLSHERMAVIRSRGLHDVISSIRSSIAASRANGSDAAGSLVDPGDAGALGPRSGGTFNDTLTIYVSWN